MNEKRTQSRPRALKGARIVFGSGPSVIDCTIRNRSPKGARLSVLTIVGVPDQFELHDNVNGEKHIVTVVWRQERMLGVKFDAT
jgi:hypothetical protein